MERKDYETTTNLIDEAYRWFKIIRNCFSPCANNSCCSKEESVNICPCEL